MRFIPLRQLHASATRLIVGANHSVDLLAAGGFGFANSGSFLKTEALLSLIDHRLAVRCIVNFSSTPNSETSFENFPFDKLIKSPYWQIRTYDQFSPAIIIADKERGLNANTLYSDEDTIISLLENPEDIAQVSALFELLWERSELFEPEITSLYKDLSLDSDSDKVGKIITVSDITWKDLISYLAKQPEHVYSLSPRKFEELVAELLNREGLRVQLTPPSKDGGRDILAFMSTAVGEHLYLVECKRFSKARPVQVGLVRTLYGVLEAEKATAGLIVTTSYFTKGALAFRNALQHRLSLTDYTGLVQWLRKSG